MPESKKSKKNNQLGIFVVIILAVLPILFVGAESFDLENVFDFNLPFLNQEQGETNQTSEEEKPDQEEPDARSLSVEERLELRNRSSQFFREFESLENLGNNQISDPSFVEEAKPELEVENKPEKPKENIVSARVDQPSCLIIRERVGSRIGDYKYKNKDLACLPHRASVRVHLDKGEINSHIKNVSSSGTYTFVYMEEVGGRNRSGWVAKEFLDFD